MSTIPPVCYNPFPTPSHLPDEPEIASLAPPPAQVSEEQACHRNDTHGRDFGRLSVLSVTRLGDEDPAQKKRKRRYGCFRKKLLLSRPRGNGHPAAVDGRYRRVFPWRDQRNQLYVHPELADPVNRTRVDPSLCLLAVAIGKHNADQIRCDIGKSLFHQNPANAQRWNEKERDIVNGRYDMLLANLYTSLEKAMRGEEPVPPEEVYVRILQGNDLAPGESALKGQYGLFNRRNANGKWRSVAEGMHLCFFSGFFCRNETEYSAECNRHSHQEVAAYALTIGEADYSCISPYGGGDLGQFANSALTKDTRGRLVEDEIRTNTRFACAEVIFEDNRPGGRRRHLVYPVVFLYMLAAPETGMAEREARVWYGQTYWDSVEDQ
jgi:hypothetical protein